jgi:flagellar L-ring protein precursor FlgH
MIRPVLMTAIVLMSLAAPLVEAQTSSLGAKQRQADVRKPPDPRPRAVRRVERNTMYEQYSWITAKPIPPRTFKVGDLITIIVRETRRFEADADLETKIRLDLQSQLNAFLKLTKGGLGAATFQRGKPTVNYKYNNRLKSEGDTEREDRLTLRLTGKIIDVKPNGLLVLEARAKVRHDDELSVITLTGTCRKEDVTADNTVLSTQIADKNLVIDNHGALRAASSRGWILKLLDLFKPF